MRSRSNLNKLFFLISWHIDTTGEGIFHLAGTTGTEWGGPPSLRTLQTRTNSLIFAPHLPFIQTRPYLYINIISPIRNKIFINCMKEILIIYDGLTTLIKMYYIVLELFTPVLRRLISAARGRISFR